jgi:hypothetical protein
MYVRKLVLESRILIFWQVLQLLPQLGYKYYENAWPVEAFLLSRLKYTSQQARLGKIIANGPGVLPPAIPSASSTAPTGPVPSSTILRGCTPSETQEPESGSERD